MCVDFLENLDEILKVDISKIISVKGLMKKLQQFLLIAVTCLVVSCGNAGSGKVPVAEMPDPAIYALTINELPEVGFPWQQTYNQTTTEQGYKWSYLAYQAYQAGNPVVGLDTGFAVNNDVVLYEADVSRDELPKPPDTLGEIQDVSWKSVPQSHSLGDKSAVWKTTIGDLATPAWWLEFYQGHAYVRISLLGFTDQIAPAILYGLGDIVSGRLPSTADALRTDAATQVATHAPAIPTITPQVSPVIGITTTPLRVPEMAAQDTLSPLNYTAPPGETGMVTLFDDTGNQLLDGIKGTDDFLADLGQGSAYEWVGWTDLTEPVTLTFAFEGDSSIASIEMGINHREGLGIFVPELVTINGVDFVLSADEVANNQRKDIVFNGPFRGPEVQIVLHHRGRGWILVDEVHFTP
jgi:hypothetical protein